MIHRIVIPDFRFTSINQMHSSVHWAKRAKLKKKDREYIWAFAKDQRVPQASGKRKVSIEVVITGRQQETDPDALWKSCLDALVHCGMLVDDKDRWCELGIVTYTKGDCTQTTVILEDC